MRPAGQPAHCGPYVSSVARAAARARGPDFDFSVLKCIKMKKKMEKKNAGTSRAMFYDKIWPLERRKQIVR